ncbi:aminotransferase class III-fold pyridoxal phosphate-dependent enzyme [Shigella flexneri]
MCDREGILLIADEIATGFGRTGKLFACEYAEITPTFVLGKPLTATITLSATRTTRPVGKPSVTVKPGAYAWARSHGQSTGLRGRRASLAMLESGDWRCRSRLLKCSCASKLPAVDSRDGLRRARTRGDRRDKNHSSGEYGGAQKFFVEQGVWIRPVGRLIS